MFLFRFLAYELFKTHHYQGRYEVRWRPGKKSLAPRGRTGALMVQVWRPHV